MRKSQALMMVLAAGCATAAMADFPLLPAIEKRVNLDGTPATGFAGRAGIVYDNGFSTAAGSSDNGAALGTTHILEDVDFTGGPWATAATRHATALGFTVQANTNTVNCISGGTWTYDVLIEVFDGGATGDVSYDTANMLDKNGDATLAVPIAAYRVGPLNGTCGFQTLWTTNLINGTTATGFNFPSVKAFMRYRIVNTGTSVLQPYAAAGTGTQVSSPVFVRGLGANAVGTNTADYGRDINGNGVDLPAGPSGLEGGTPVITGGAAGAHEHRQVSATVVQSERAKIEGDIVATAPPCTSVTLADLPSNNLQTYALTAGQVKWFCITIPAGGATDANNKFLDIDTETSGPTTMTLALYDSTGTLLNVDSGDGSGNQAQLTYGICRRAPVGDGRDYDGRDGQLAAGTYWVGVAAGNIAFTAGWAPLSTTNTDVGTVNVHFMTNVNAGALAAASQPSVYNLASNDFGVLSPPGALGTLQSAGPLNILWYKFNLPTAITAGGTSYLDFDMSSGGNPATDSAVGLYTSAGALLVSDADSGDGLQAQLSFGATSPTRAAIGTGLAFAGQNGGLAAGTYYVGVGLATTTFSATRGCVRTTSGSNLQIPMTLNYFVGSSCHGACVADFDDGTGTGTPDGGVTIDDLLYYLFIFDIGQLCADVDDGTFSGTQDGGVTIDDLLYYLFRFDAGC